MNWDRIFTTTICATVILLAVVGCFIFGEWDSAREHDAFPQRITNIHRDADNNVEYDIVTNAGNARKYWDYFDDGTVDDIWVPNFDPPREKPLFGGLFSDWKPLKHSDHWDQEWAQARFNRVHGLAVQQGLLYWHRN